MRYLMLVLSLLFVSACNVDVDQPSVKQQQAEKARKAAQSITFTENAEIENIKKRLELTSDPGLMGFILLMNQAGQPIMYTGVKGKITSGSKRLTQKQVYGRVPDADGEGTTCCFETDAPSDEGTYGSSNPYIYFWTTGGQYIQWNGPYLYSDQPFRIDSEALIVKLVSDQDDT